MAPAYARVHGGPRCPGRDRARDRWRGADPLPRRRGAAGPADVAEWEHGATTPVVAELGPPGLDTLDTLIRAGFAATRAQAIRWALDRIRERPAYERLRDLQRDTDALKDEF